MKSMSVELTPSLKQFVDQRVSDGGYGSASEYIRELIRHDHHRVAKDALEAELLRGLASGPAEKMTKAKWAKMKTGVLKRIGDKKR